jgi:hypothetical protein
MTNSGTLLENRLCLMNVLFAGPEYWTLKLNIAERMEIVGLLTEKCINVGSQIFGVCCRSSLN